MDLFDTILTRRSIRAYEQGLKIGQEDLNKIMRAAMYAPSAMHKEPWHFIVVQDDAMIQKISMLHPYAHFIIDAGTAIFVCEDTSKSHAGMGIIDTSLASQNIMLSAHALGYGTCYCGVYPLYDGMFDPLLSLPPHIKIHGLIALGTPTKIPTTNERFTPNKIHYEKW